MTIDLLIYSVTPRDIEKGAFMDLAKLTAGDVGPTSNINVVFAYQTETMGNWIGRVMQDATVNMQRSDDDTSCFSVEALSQFLRGNASIRAKVRMLVLSAHGCGWLLFNKKVGEPFLIKDIAKSIRASGLQFDVICLDCCLMATLECACELQPFTKYVIACQNYAPWHGVISSRLIENLIKYKNNALELCKSICDAFYEMNMADPESTDAFDMSVIDTRRCMELYKQLPNTATSYPRKFRIDPKWDVLYDLHSVLSANGLLTASKRACVPYRVASANTPPWFRGLSISKFPNQDTSWEHTHTYHSGVSFVNPLIAMN